MDKTVTLIAKELSKNHVPSLADWAQANGFAAQHGISAALKDGRKTWTREHVQRYRLTDLGQVHIWRRGKDWSCAPENVIAPGMTRPLESGDWTDDEIRIFLTAWWRTSIEVLNRIAAPRTAYALKKPSLWESIGDERPLFFRV